MFKKIETSKNRRLVFISAARSSWGAEQSMYALAAHARTTGIEVKLLCFPGTIEADWEAATGVRASPIATAAPQSEAKITENLLLMGAYLRGARTFDRVLLFTYYLGVSAAPLNLLLAGRGVRFGLDLHDNLAGNKGRMLLRIAAKGIHQVTCCSTFTANQLADRTGALPHAVNALHGPAEALPVRVSKSDGPLRVCIAGRIIGEKRHDVVARAVAQLGPDAIMVLRGGGDGSVHDNSEEIRALCTELLGARFRDEGKVEPARVLDDIDVMVVANPGEPMGRTVLEAQLSGVLAVVPDAGGSAELVINQVTGYHFAANDPTDLARVLRDIAMNPEAQARVRAAAQTRATGTVTTAAYAGAYLRLLAG